MPKSLKRGRRPGRLITMRPVFHASYLLVFAVVAVVIGIQYVASHADGYPITVNIQTSGLSDNLTGLYSGNHSFGTCSRAPGPGYSFSAPTVCQGNSFGGTSSNPADTVTLYAPSSYDGINFLSWTTVSNGLSGGTVSCDSSSSYGCVLSLAPGVSGTLTISANYGSPAPPPPSPAVGPVISGSAVSSTAINVSWTAGQGTGGAAPTGYVVRINNDAIATVGSTVHSRQVTGLACATHYSFSVDMQYSGGDATSNTISVATSNCAVAAPKPAPVTAAPGSTTTTPGDTTPPSVPANFAAAQNGSSVVVNLTWTASTDAGTGVKGYRLDRSTDNTTWTSLQTDLTATTYSDSTTQFGTHYYYRLAAVDNAGNTSTYATANLTTASFKSTTTATIGQNVTSSDGILTVGVPSAAVAEDAACDIEAASGSVASGKLIAGPYQLVCRDQNGNDITSFTQPLVWTFVLPSATAKPYGNIQAVTFDSGGEASLASKQFNRKTRTIVFASSTAVEGGVVGIVTHSIWPVIFEVLFIVMLVLGGVYYIGLKRLRKQNYDDYLRHKYNDL